MRTMRIGAVAATAIAAVATISSPANATDWLTAKLPSVNSSGTITATAVMLGPEKAGTRLCASLLESTPYTPPIQLAEKCITSQGGSVSVSLKNARCGSYRTFASAQWGGSGAWTSRESKAAVYCPS